MTKKWRRFVTGPVDDVCEEREREKGGRICRRNDMLAG